MIMRGNRLEVSLTSKLHFNNEMTRENANFRWVQIPCTAGNRSLEGATRKPRRAIISWGPKFYTPPPPTPENTLLGGEL